MKPVPFLRVLIMSRSRRHTSRTAPVRLESLERRTATAALFEPSRNPADAQQLLVATARAHVVVPPYQPADPGPYYYRVAFDGNATTTVQLELTPPNGNPIDAGLAVYDADG